VTPLCLSPCALEWLGGTTRPVGRGDATPSLKEVEERGDVQHREMAAVERGQGPGHRVGEGMRMPYSPRGAGVPESPAFWL